MGNIKYNYLYIYDICDMLLHHIAICSWLISSSAGGHQLSDHRGSHGSPLETPRRAR